MPRATCRCGQNLEMPLEGVDHTVCPRCSAKVRIVRKLRPGSPAATSPAPGDGFIRFSCPCGRRLKVSAVEPPSHGKCPDCERIVPVPGHTTSASSKAESPTEEMAVADLAMLDAWAKSHASRANGTGNGPPTSTAEMASNSSARPAEAGFRVCPRCGKPLHLTADTCRTCGIRVPKR